MGHVCIYLLKLPLCGERCPVFALHVISYDAVIVVGFLRHFVLQVCVSVINV